ncbi:hypothetical protein IAT38_006770 [Cryptococcus sp. DSM 104549]
MGDTSGDPTSKGPPLSTADTDPTPDISKWKMPTSTSGKPKEDSAHAPEGDLIAFTPPSLPAEPSSGPRMSTPFPSRTAPSVASDAPATTLPKPRVPSSNMLLPTQPDTSDGNISFVTARSEVDGSSDEHNTSGDSESMVLEPLGRESSEPREAPPQISAAAIPAGTAELGTTPASAGAASMFSTPADISFGPQSLPFMFRRRDIDQSSTPSKAPARGARALKLPWESNVPAITIRPDEPQRVPEADSAGVQETAEREQAARPTPPRPAFQQAPERKLSSWRREQLRWAAERPPTLMGDPTPRPIPTLYGPLSLPYARNPSGVDATVADETAYLSHVFGLRPVPGGAAKNTSTNTSRSVSTGTQSSGTQSRSTSGSSVYASSGGTKRSTDVSLLTEGSSYLSSGGAYHPRPLVMRDPYQNIGIRKGAVGMKDAGAETIPARPYTVQAPAAAVHLTNTYGSNNDYAGIFKDTPTPLSPDDKRHVSDSATLEPRLGMSVIGPSKSYHNIREFTALSPIPGSPVESSRRQSSIPFMLPNRRLRAASVSAADQNQHPQRRPTEDYTSSYAPPIRIPAFVPVYYDPASMTYELNLSPERPAAREHLPIFPAAAGQAAKPQTAASSSKADVSDNWRTRAEARKAHGGAGGAAVYSSTPVKARGGAEGQQREQGAAGAEGAGRKVMTIDSLFERFASPRNSHRVAIKSPAMDSPATKSVPKYTRQATTAAPSTPRNAAQPLSEISANVNTKAPTHTPVTPNKASVSNTNKTPGSPKSAPSSRRFTSTSAAKGTPGAGELLKKSAKAISEPGDDALAIPPTPELVADKPSHGRRRRGGKR